MAVTPKRRIAKPQEAELSKFFAAAPVGLAVLDADLKYVHVNEALARIHGRPASAHRGKTVRQVVPTVAPAIEPILRRVLAMGAPSQRVEVTGELPSHPGEKRVLAISALPVSLNGSKGRGVGAVIVDVTVLNLSSVRFDRSVLAERRFRALIENSSDAIALISADGTVTYSSPSTSRLLGYESDELIGHSVFDLVHPDDLDRVKALVTPLAGEPGARVVIETRLRHKDGSWRWLESTLMNLIGEASVGAIVVNSHDLTERKQSEEALREINEKLMFWARQLERHNRELSLIREMGEMLLACHDAGEAYHVIARSARDLFPECSGVMYLVTPARNLAEPVATWGPKAVPEVMFERDDCWALRLNRPHVSAGEDTDLFCRHLGSPPPPASLCVQMVGQGETLGVLHLRFETAAPEEIDACRPLATEVAARIVLSLDNLKLRETLRAQSIRDTLTHLYNRRYMEESLERELRRADRVGQPVAVIVFDLDNFKVVNDTFGHDAGDVMLQAFGEFVRVRIREGDIACRYGGEEFVLILPGASLRDAVVRAHKLREGSRDLIVSHKGRVLGPLTLSLGVAVFPGHGTTANDLLVAADQALYRAKQQGRDRVEVAKTDAAS